MASCFRPWTVDKDTWKAVQSSMDEGDSHEAMQILEESKKKVSDQGKLTLTIISGKALPKMDRNVLGKKTSSDPYVSFKTRSTPPQETKPIKKNLNPKWNETFVCPLVSLGEVIVFDVKG